MSKAADAWKTSFSNQEKTQIFLFCKKFVVENAAIQLNSLIMAVTRSVVDHFFKKSKSRTSFLHAIKNLKSSLTSAELKEIVRVSTTKHVKSLLNFFFSHQKSIQELSNDWESKRARIEGALRTSSDRFTEEQKAKLTQNLGFARSKRDGYIQILEMMKKRDSQSEIASISSNINVVKVLQGVKSQIVQHEKSSQPQKPSSSNPSQETRPKGEVVQPPPTSSSSSSSSEMSKTDEKVEELDGNPEEEVLFPKKFLSLEECVEKLEVHPNNIIPEIPSSKWIINNELNLFDENFVMEENDVKEKEDQLIITDSFSDNSDQNKAGKKRKFEVFRSEDTIMTIVPKKKRKLDHLTTGDTKNQSNNTNIEKSGQLNNDHPLSCLLHYHDEDLDDDATEDNKQSESEKIFPSTELESEILHKKRKKKKKKNTTRRR